MTVSRRQSATSSVVLAVSLAMCLGAAAQTASATTVILPTTAERPTLSVGQREALQSLLSCLTDVARQFQGKQHHSTALSTIDRQTIERSTLILERCVTPQIPTRGPIADVALDLLNLPPPARV